MTETETSDNAVRQFENTSATTLSRNEAEERLTAVIRQGFNTDSPVLVEALPTIGKSSGLIKWAATTGNPLTTFTARRDLYKQFEDWCEEAGLTYKRLPSFHSDCATANGEHGNDWKARVWETYRTKKLFGGEIHGLAEELYGEPLPCQENGECSFFTERAFDPAEYDVLVGHYVHAHTPVNSRGTDFTKGRYVAFDEFPEDGFLTTYSTGTVTRAVGAFLDRNNDCPYRFPKQFRTHRYDSERRREGEEWFNQHGLRRNVGGVVNDQNDSLHVDEAIMAYALFAAEDLDNGWEYAHLPNKRKAVIHPSDESLIVLTPPTLKGAESVIALDGTPTIEKWRLLLGEDLQHLSVLTDAEKRAYLRHTLGIRVIQTNNEAKPYSSGWHVTPPKDLALIEGVGLRENTLPSLITSKRALRQYEERGLEELVDETKYYGKFKGSNDFESKRVGIVIGSPHYGDDELEKWGALAGRSVSRTEDTYGFEVDFGDFGNQLLYGMRENGVLQAVMRFGRDGGGATVYVHTAALPEWVKREEGLPRIHTWQGDGMEEVIAAVNDLDRPEWRAKHIFERVSITDPQVRTHLNNLADYGFLETRRDGGRGNPITWIDAGIASVGAKGHVEFDATER